LEQSCQVSYHSDKFKINSILYSIKNTLSETARDSDDNGSNIFFGKRKLCCKKIRLSCKALIYGFFFRLEIRFKFRFLQNMFCSSFTREKFITTAKGPFNSPFRANVGSQTMCFPYHPSDPNPIPSSMTVNGTSENGREVKSAKWRAHLPMARVEPVRCQMVRACPMRADCDVSHLMHYPISWRCSEMIVCLIMMSLNSQMLTSCLMMISSFAVELS